MRCALAIAILTSILVADAACAQQHEPTRHEHHQPYAGLEKRTIKALSEQQLADLRAGRGMSLALAAELNGYPGPKHVLEHAQTLNLAADQRAEIESLFEAMRQEAINAGEAVIAAEANLDQLFAEGSADAASLDAAMRQVGHAHMILRRTHLAYHLSTKAVLTPEQVAAYNRLRGYVSN